MSDFITFLCNNGIGMVSPLQQEDYCKETNLGCSGAGPDPLFIWDVLKRKQP